MPRRSRPVPAGPERRHARPERRRAERLYGRASTRRGDRRLSDGWTENLFAPGQHAVSDYPMDQRAALQWYHDHVMGVTQLRCTPDLRACGSSATSASASSACPRGRRLRCRCCCRTATSGRPHAAGSPASWCTRPTRGRWRPSRRSPWSTARYGRSTTCSRRRTGCACSTGPMPARSGSSCCATADPTRADHPDRHRWRPAAARPVAVPADGLVLAPAERADLLVDFSDLGRAAELTLVNTAGAPFDGRPSPPRVLPRPPTPASSCPTPMSCASASSRAHRRAGRGPGAWPPTSLLPPSADLSGAVRRAVALVEQELDGRPNMVTMRELAEAPDGDLQEPVITIVGQHGKTMARLRTVAASTSRTSSTFFPTL